jgi:hypothetical protein
MAVSPLIMPPASAEKNPSSKSKLSSSIFNTNGNSSEKASSTDGAGPDLAEQMNAHEKAKYVKGKCNDLTPSQ